MKIKASSAAFGSKGIIIEGIDLIALRAIEIAQIALDTRGNVIDIGKWKQQIYGGEAALYVV